MAGPTGFEPAIFSVTGRRDRPLHYEPKGLLTPNKPYLCERTEVIIADFRVEINAPEGDLYQQFRSCVRLGLANEKLGFFFFAQGVDVRIERLEVENNVRSSHFIAIALLEFDDFEAGTGTDHL